MGTGEDQLTKLMAGWEITSWGGWGWDEDAADMLGVGHV